MDYSSSPDSDIVSQADNYTITDSQSLTLANEFDIEITFIFTQPIHLPPDNDHHPEVLWLLNRLTHPERRLDWTELELLQIIVINLLLMVIWIGASYI